MRKTIALIAVISIIMSVPALADYQPYDYGSVVPGFQYEVTGVQEDETGVDPNTCAHSKATWAMEVQEEDDLDCYTQRVKVEAVDAHHHEITAHPMKQLYCPECGTDLGDPIVSDEIITFTQSHFWKYDENLEREIGVCEVCGYVCPHDVKRSRENSEQYMEIAGDDRYHQTIYPAGGTDVYCADCRESLPDESVPATSELGEHDYDEFGVCNQCGHQRAACGHVHVKTWENFETTYYDANQQQHDRYGAPVSVDDYHHSVDGDVVRHYYCYDCDMEWEEIVQKQVHREIRHSYNKRWDTGELTCWYCGHVNLCTHPNKYAVEYLEDSGGVATDAYGLNDFHRVHSHWYFGDYCPDCGMVVNCHTASLTAELRHEYDANGLCPICDHYCTHEGDLIAEAEENVVYSGQTPATHRKAFDVALPAQCPYCGLALGGSKHEESVLLHSFDAAGICADCGYDLYASNPALSTLSLPEDLVALEASAFEGDAPECVVVPDGCTTIESRAFADCPSLIIIQIPNSVTAIAEDAFAGDDEFVIVAPANSEAIRFARRKGIACVAV